MQTILLQSMTKKKYLFTKKWHFIELSANINNVTYRKFYF